MGIRWRGATRQIERSYHISTGFWSAGFGPDFGPDFSPGSGLNLLNCSPYTVRIAHSVQEFVSGQ